MASGVQLGRQVAGNFHADVLLHHFGLMPILHTILHMVYARKTQTSNPASRSLAERAIDYQDRRD